MMLFEHDTSYQTSTFPPSRQFQDSAHQSLRDGVKAGHKRQVIMASTGAGKTFLGMRIIHEALLRGKRCLFACDRTTLINQTSEVADRYGLSTHGVIQAQHWRFNPDLPFQIASIQTLARRGWPENLDVVVIDECHAQYKTVTEYIQSSTAHIIGLSATPFSTGLGKIYTNLINASTMDELIKQEILVPLKVFSCTQISMNGAATAGGEWTDVAAQDRGMEIIGDVVTEWSKYADGKKTICFGATIKHCEEICRQFNEVGIMAAVFCAHTTPEERAELLKEYRKPDSVLRVLVSVEALAKGFDVPDVECICDLRPLRKSLSTALQMWGRGLRSSPETGKTQCILLDFSGNIIRFKEDFEEIFFNGLSELNSGEKLDKKIRQVEDEEKERKGCPRCGHKPFYKHCMSCGFEMVQAALVEAVHGEMQEVFIGKKKLADDKLHLYSQLVTYARQHSAPEKQKGRAAHLYKDLTGDWPSRFWDFNSAPETAVTQATLNQVRRKNIAFSKGRKAA